LSANVESYHHKWGKVRVHHRFGFLLVSDN
jgi:hypothetical protein